MQNTALELAPHDPEIGKIVQNNFHACHALFGCEDRNLCRQIEFELRPGFLRTLRD
jgi:hypothetical protein